MRFRFVVLLALTLLAARGASAAPVIIDGKEWRPLTETTGFSWLIANSACGTGLCSGSIGSVSVDGWYWADTADVLGLFEALIQPDSIQFPTPTSSYTAASDPDIAAAVSSIFEPTSIFDLGTNQYREVRGLTRASSGSTTTLAYLLDNPFPTGLDFAAFDTQYPTNLGGSHTGLWLYRPAAVPVPEPGAFALFGAGLAGLALVRRRRSNASAARHAENASRVPLLASSASS